MEKMEGIELHVICPVRDLARYEVRYVENNIHFIFPKNPDTSLDHLILKCSQLFSLDEIRDKKILILSRRFSPEEMEERVWQYHAKYAPKPDILFPQERQSYVGPSNFEFQQIDDPYESMIEYLERYDKTCFHESKKYIEWYHRN